MSGLGDQAGNLARVVLMLMLFTTTQVLEANEVNQAAGTQGHRSIEHLQIQVMGTDPFITQVQSCLDLLAEKAPEDLSFVQRNIGLIKQHQKSGMVAWADPPRYEMSSRTAMFSLTWCASTIAHDAYHSHLYQKYRHVHKGRLLYKLWAGFKAEARSIHYQTQVAKRLGAPNEELNYLVNLKGTHSDLDGDQKLTNKDYQKRDW